MEVVMKWFLYAIKKYAVFSGRAQRKEYWYFTLFYYFFGLLLSLLTLIPNPNIGNIFGIIAIIYSLALFIPVLAVTVRRLHDIDRSGFSLFFAFIPLVGIILLLIFLTKDGTLDVNKYGINPKTIITEKIDKKKKLWFFPLLIVIVIFMMISFYYFGFRSIGSKEQFGIFNTSGNDYYLNVVSNTSISQFSLKRSVEINGVNYYFIINTGQYKLRGARNIFQSERNDEINIDLKLKDIFSEFNIVDANNNIIWDLFDDSFDKITRVEHPIGTIFWILSME